MSTDAGRMATKALTNADGVIENLTALLDGDYYGGDEPLPTPVRRKAAKAIAAARDLHALIADLYEEMP